MCVRALEKWVSHSFPDAPAKSIARWSGPDIHGFRQADGEDSWRTNIECLQNVTLRHLAYCIHSFINPKGNLRTRDIAFCYGQTKRKTPQHILLFHIISTLALASQQAWPPYILVSPTANSLRMLRWSCCSSWVKAYAATNTWLPRFEKAKVFDLLNYIVIAWRKELHAAHNVGSKHLFWMNAKKQKHKHRKTDGHITCWPLVWTGS